VAVDRFDQLAHAFQLTIILGADDFFYDGTQHTTSGSVNSQAIKSAACQALPCSHGSDGSVTTDSGKKRLAILNTID
jgi:hypothetical protein